MSGQWTAICGNPGRAPSAISSMLGWVAAVSETESPSQLRPALIHSTWMRVSSAFLASSVSMGRPPFRRVPFSDHRPPYLPAAGPFLPESGIPRFPDFSLADLLPDRLTVARMHELAIAESVLSTIAARVGDRTVHEVRLEVGKLSGISAESLRFCFSLAAEGTAVSGAALDIVEPPGQALCSSCGSDFALLEPFPLCACGSSDVRVLGGNELRILSVEVSR